jgi:hypothetical protein
LPTSGGGTITLAGSNFGVADRSQTGAFGSTRCTTSMWMSVSSLHCRAETPAHGAHWTASLILRSLIGERAPQRLTVT